MLGGPTSAPVVGLGELGPLLLVADGQRHAVSGPRTAALLAALSLAGPVGSSTEALLEEIWPSPGQPASARQSLANLVSRLRNRYGAGVIESIGYGYRLGPNVTSERAEFLRLLAEATARVEESPAQAHRLATTALGLWRAEAWCGLEVPHGVAADRAHLHERRLDILQVTVDALAAMDRPTEATEFLAELVDARPTIERNWLLLARLESRRGSRPGALTMVRSARRALLASGLDLSDDLERLERHLLVPTVESNGRFPVATTPALGRADELAEIADLLATRCVVTLTGAGGVGKTRLAMELAGTSSLPAVFIDLVPIRDGGLCAATLTAGLGVVMDGLRSPLEGAIRELAVEPRLVVLDNCEHVLEGAAELALQLSAACPESRLLVTSREPLSIDGERVVRVEPLPTDADGPCVALFHRRAREAGVRLEPSESQGVVAKICQALDGLPLAIELAAGRSTILSPSEILESLNNRFDLLRSPKKSGRHSALYDTILWSWQQLGDDDRRAIAQLAAFASPATLESVAEVLAEPFTVVIDRFDRLASKSLVVVTRNRDEVTRVLLLDSIRHFALDQARSSDSFEPLANAHLRWVDRQTSEMVGPHGFEAGHPDDLVGLDSMAAEIRLALDRAAVGGDAGTGLRVCTRIFNWWRGRGAADEGCARLEALDDGAAPAVLRIEAAACGATLARLANRPVADIATLSSRARELLATTPEFDGRARAEIRLIEAEFDDRDPHLPARLLEVVDLARRAGTPEDAIALHLLTAWTLTNDPQAAPARADETLAASERANTACLGHARELQGLAHVATGRPEAAAQYLLQAIQLFEDIGQRFCTLHCAESIAWCCAAGDDVATAKEVLAAAEGVRAVSGRVRAGFEQQAIRGATDLLGDLPPADTKATLDSVVDRARAAIRARQ